MTDISMMGPIMMAYSTMELYPESNLDAASYFCQCHLTSSQVVQIMLWKEGAVTRWTYCVKYWGLIEMIHFPWNRFNRNFEYFTLASSGNITCSTTTCTKIFTKNHELCKKCVPEIQLVVQPRSRQGDDLNFKGKSLRLHLKEVQQYNQLQDPEV